MWSDAFLRCDVGRKEFRALSARSYVAQHGGDDSANAVQQFAFALGRSHPTGLASLR
jgi:hypothetical protein